MRYQVAESPDTKMLRSDKYNFNFNKHDGFFMRWGETYEDNPRFSPFGPEILDLEISVNGCPNNCPFCYKGNTNQPATNMSLEDHNKIIDIMPKTLTQIAYGITGVQTNPDFIEMMKYARSKGIIPNFTLSGIDLTDEIAEEVAGISGALAVSAYESDKNVCYDTVKKFTDLGMKQVNIHLMVSMETLPFVTDVLHDRIHDPRLKDMNAIVFLGVKGKGRAKDRYHPLNAQAYDLLVKSCRNIEISYGFDSCSAPKFEHAVRSMDISDEDKKNLIQCSESCESSLFSAYINVYGEYWNCSFSEDEDGVSPVNVLKAKDFVRDVWYHPAVVDFRERLLKTEINGCRMCPTFPEINP